MRNFDREGRFTYADWDKKIRRIGFDIWPQDNYYPYPPAHDARIVFLSMTARGRTPTPQLLPHPGTAIWLSQFRPNLPRGVTVPRDLYDRYLQRQRYRHVGLDYGSRWISERFRTFTEHRAVTPIYAIVTGPSPSAEEMETAEKLSAVLGRMFGVRLPINPPGVALGPNTGNVLLLGDEACLAARRITRAELKHAGPEGFVINAYQGRVAIAGTAPAGTSQGTARYLEDHGVRFLARDRITVPRRANDFLHELYLLDWPFFPRSPIRSMWEAAETDGSAPAPASKGAARARALARRLKRAARAGARTVPASVSSEINASPLSRYVAAKLLWDPFADASRLIREFGE
jgi:hypothetical protein